MIVATVTRRGIIVALMVEDMGLGQVETATGEKLKGYVTKLTFEDGIIKWSILDLKIADEAMDLDRARVDLLHQHLAQLGCYNLQKRETIQ